MDRRETRRADGVVAEFLHSSGLETPYLQYKLVQAWPNVVDEVIAQSTQALAVREQSLWVRVEVPALRTQLAMMRGQLVQKLNAIVGSIIIYDINLV